MSHVINIEDFDPVYRKKEFQNIKKYAMDILDLRKGFSQQQYNEMRQELKSREDRVFNFVDQDQVDFLNSDPRIEHLDDG